MPTTTKKCEQMPCQDKNDNLTIIWIAFSRRIQETILRECHSKVRITLHSILSKCDFTQKTSMPISCPINSNSIAANVAQWLLRLIHAPVSIPYDYRKFSILNNDHHSLSRSARHLVADPVIPAYRFQITAYRFPFRSGCLWHWQRFTITIQDVRR